MDKLHYIAFISVPSIVNIGIAAILKTAERKLKTRVFDSVEEFLNATNRSLFTLVIVNSDISGNEMKQIQNIRANIPDAKIIGIIASSPGRDFIRLLDDKIYLNDDARKIIEIVDLCLSGKNKSKQKSAGNSLSEREIEVLKLLIKGKTNKEIADELFISIHTVISHRKNITGKLGIRSTAAMAIYAVANNLIDIRDSLNLMK